MPIADDMKEHYPDDWDDIRARILERATQPPGALAYLIDTPTPCCERCRRPNGVTVFTFDDGGWEALAPDADTPMCWLSFNKCGELLDVDPETCCTWMNLLPLRDERKTTTVLTVAHLCQDPRCDDLDHLRALCQRCHLTYDAQPEQRAIRERIQAELRGQQTIGPPAGCEEVVQ